MTVELHGLELGEALKEKKKKKKRYSTDMKSLCASEGQESKCSDWGMYLQVIYLIRGLYLQYIKTSYQSMTDNTISEQRV
jgi:hypothetical protein